MNSSAYERVTTALAAVTHYQPANDKAGWKCPAHTDNSPSLSVTNGAGKVLIHCQAGCDLPDILRVLGLEPKDLFDDEPQRRGTKEIVAEYSYTDEHGKELFQAVRFQPKDFRQRRRAPDDPNADKDGWAWNLQGVRRVLYRLPDVLEAVAAGVTVYVVEGEKDVHALEAVGEVATCCPMGAGKWKPEYGYADVLKGANVVVVADQDPPGIKHAADVEASLQGVAASVRVVAPAVGKDAADHLGAGKTVAEFVGDEPESDPVDAAIVEWATFWLDDGSTGEWLVEPILPAGRQVAMFAVAKAGKSLLALEVAAALATGRAVLDQPAGPPRRVVYLDWEQSADDLRDRLADMGYGAEVDMGNLVYYLLPNMPPLDTKAGGEVIAGILERWQPAAVVIDTMARAVAGAEDESDTLRAFYRFTGTRLKAAGVALLRLDHAGKDPLKGQRGTSAKTEDVDVVFRLTTDGRRVELRRTHSRVPWVPEHVVLTRQDEPHLFHEVEGGDVWLPGTGDTAADLDELEVPLDASVSTASARLKAAGRGRRRVVVLDALKFRRRRPGPVAEPF